MTSRAIIREGDPTSHGGTVLEGFPSLAFYGKRAAGIGHRGYCPQCKQDFLIIEGASNRRHMGRGIAVEGMRTSCGATLIATQQQAKIQVAFGDSAGAAPGSGADAHAPSYDVLDLEYYFVAVHEDGSAANLTYRIDSGVDKLHEGIVGPDGRTVAVPVERLGEATFWTAAQ